jgi:hypothetical protein
MWYRTERCYKKTTGILTGVITLCLGRNPLKGNVTCYDLYFCKNKLIPGAIQSGFLKFNNKRGKMFSPKCFSPVFISFKGENKFCSFTEFSA